MPSGALLGFQQLRWIGGVAVGFGWDNSQDLLRFALSIEASVSLRCCVVSCSLIAQHSSVEQHAPNAEFASVLDNGSKLSACGAKYSTCVQGAKSGHWNWGDFQGSSLNPSAPGGKLPQLDAYLVLAEQPFYQASLPHSCKS